MLPAYIFTKCELISIDAIGRLSKSPKLRTYSLSNQSTSNSTFPLRHCLRRASSRLLGSAVSSQSRSAARSQLIAGRQSIQRLSPRSQYPTALQIRWNSNQNDLSPVSPEKEQRNQELDAQDKETEVANAPESAPSNVGGQQKPQEKTTEALKIKIPPNETVYIGNLFYDVTAEDLRTRMEKYGTVLNTMIAHDNRGLSKG